ncbi:MAG: cobalamin biosynthesis protein CbiX [Gammaproteobacteria bacterium]|nr:cobalamin biosynthesis protein CbiX [Gammaproteobacteria bacterium]
MKALIIIAHGSRREEANDEIKQLARYLAENDQSDFDYITHSFLEMGQPDIPKTVNEVIQSNAAADGATSATQIVILPYFLAAGAHVARDIPGIIEDLKVIHPTVTFSIMPHIGSTEGMKRLLSMQIQQASFRKD